MISDFTRAKAAATTARNHPLCKAIQPFYWEIGNKSGPLAAASIPSGTRTTVEAGSIVQIASASKWIYSSYVVEKLRQMLTVGDINFLTFTTGYSNFRKCEPNQTVGQCAADGRNDLIVTRNVGTFDYGGGHMQQHAVQRMGLSAFDNAALASEIGFTLGIKLSYSSPQLAGGAQMSASAYAKFLRKILANQLLIADELGMWKVATAGTNSPIPADESWSYSLGHWVENDPNVGDGSFSSAGAFGFYPWIDASKTYYGVVSRFNLAGAFESVRAGRVIRQAWLTGVAVV